MKIYEGKIPFCKKSNYQSDVIDKYQMHHPDDYWHKVGDVIWKDNKSFSARIQFSGNFERGRSAAYFTARIIDIFSDDNKWNEFLENTFVILFMEQVAAILENAHVSGGITDPVQCAFYKRGQNYSLKVFF